MSDAFWTGFANSLTSGIEERRKTANDYFERQLEIAQTTGIENYKSAKAKADESLRYARQLEQMGVPRHVIMEQASANPDGLGLFYESAIEIQTNSNRPVVSEDWENLYTVANSMKGNDQDFATFFGQMYAPATQAMNNDPEGFRRDPRGSIWSAMFATNPYGDAQRRLGNTEIIDGMSASDLLLQGDSTFTGDNVVTPNVDVMRDLVGEEGELSLAERGIIGKTIEEKFASVRSEVFSAKTLNLSPDATPEEKEKVREAIIEAAERALMELEPMLTGPGEMEDARIQMQGIINAQLRAAGIPIEPRESAVVPEEGEITKEVLPPPDTDETTEVPPPENADPLPNEDELRTSLKEMDEPFDPFSYPTNSVEYAMGNLTIKTEEGNVTLLFEKVNEDGTMTYHNPESGESVTRKPSVFRRIYQESLK